MYEPLNTNTAALYVPVTPKLHVVPSGSSITIEPVIEFEDDIAKATCAFSAPPAAVVVNVPPALLPCCAKVAVALLVPVTES